MMAGAVLVRLDDRDFRAQVDQATAQVDQATANMANIDAQVGRSRRLRSPSRSKQLVRLCDRDAGRCSVIVCFSA